MYDLLSFWTSRMYESVSFRAWNRWVYGLGDGYGDSLYDTYEAQDDRLYDTYEAQDDRQNQKMVFICNYLN